MAARPLPREAYEDGLIYLGLYAGTALCCRYAIPSHLVPPTEQTKLVETLELAVSRIIIEQPSLQVGIVKSKSRKPAFAQLDLVDMTKLIQWKVIEDDEDQDEVFSKLVETNIDNKFENSDFVPAWRLFVLRRKSGDSLDALLVWNHALFDGTGSKIFQQSLLRHLNANGADADADADADAKQPVLVNRMLSATATAENMPPSQHAAAKWPITTTFAAELCWEHLRPQFMKPKPNPLKCWPPIRQTKYETLRRSFSIDDDTLQAVLVACRKNKTTLTGLMHAICFVSCVTQLTEKELITASGTTAINVRRFMPPELKADKTIGIFVTRMVHKFSEEDVSAVRKKAGGDALTEGEREEEKEEKEEKKREKEMGALAGDLWSYAHRVRAEIADRMDKGLRDDDSGVMKRVAPVIDWKDFHKDDLEGARVSTWLVTNLGVLDGAGDEWSVRRGVFTLSNEIPGPFFQVSTIAIKGKELCTDVTWQAGVVDVRYGEKLTSDLEAWLRYIARESRSGTGAAAA